jgi:hypothetical protein
LVLWRAASAGAWVHYVLRSTGGKWVGGVRNDAASTPWVSISAGGVLTIAGAGGATTWVDELVLLPFAAPDAWPPLMYAFHAARAWSALPYLVPGGDYLQDLAQASLIFGVSGEREATATGTARANVTATLYEHRLRRDS